MKVSFFVSIVLVLPLLSGLLSKTEEPLAPEALGAMLFEDPVLSSDQSISCASCHLPAFGFSDTTVLSKGVGGQLGTRNTPGITNMSARSSFFWDGRAATLEMQVVQPIENTREMNLPLPIALARLRADDRYVKYFQLVYGAMPDSTNVADALAAFVRSLETDQTAFDRWKKGNKKAMSESAQRGRRVFMDKGKCFDCHFTPDFTGDEFRNIGLFNGKELFDTGRFSTTGDVADIGKFKVPGLRNVALTAPYMHNGMFRTLREVIDYYDQPDKFALQSIGTDSLLARPLGLTEAEKQDLEAFLRALTDRRWVRD